MVVSGATLAKPSTSFRSPEGDLHSLNPSTAGYIALWVGFALVSLLPLLTALVALSVSRDWTIPKPSSSTRLAGAQREDAGRGDRLGTRRRAATRRNRRTHELGDRVRVRVRVKRRSDRPVARLPCSCHGE